MKYNKTTKEKKNISLQEKYRVVHIITKLELGGAQLNTIYTYKNLDKNKFETYLFCGKGGILNNRIKHSNTLFFIKNLIRNIQPYHDLRAFIQIKNQLNRVQPHIVHTHSSKAGIIGRIAAILSGTPVIIHSVHGFSFSPFHSFWKRNLYIWLEKFIAQKTNHFIFVSQHDIRTAKKIKLIKKKFSLIRSGFPLKNFVGEKGNTRTLRKFYQIKKNDFVCGIIAPFKFQKGFPHLIEVATLILKKTKNTIFFLAGDGELSPYIHSELKKRKILEYFRMPGFISNISPIIDIFDCGVSTALWEGLPQSIVQMRLKKKAVVVSNIPGHREIIRDNQNGLLVKVHNHEIFAQKILFLMQNPAERGRLAQYQDDFSKWDAEVMVKEQERLYSRLLKSTVSQD